MKTQAILVATDPVYAHWLSEALGGGLGQRLLLELSHGNSGLLGDGVVGRIGEAGVARAGLSDAGVADQAGVSNQC